MHIILHFDTVKSATSYNVVRPGCTQGELSLPVYVHQNSQNSVGGLEENMGDNGEGTLKDS